MSHPHVHCEVLPNGLTLLLREAHLAPVANVQFWARVGSADERPGEEGLAHFHEHMLFKGTEHRGVGEIAGAVEGAGGRINAYTSYDMTVYYATLPTDALGIGVDVLADALRFSLFDPEEVKRETEVVLEEIRRSEDSPGHVLSDAVFREAYRVHPYRSPILGPAENVAAFDRDKVTRFFQRWYTPDNLVVVAAGDFRPEVLAEQIRAAFEDAEPVGVQRERPEEPLQTELRSVLLERPFENVRLDLSWPAASFREEDATHLELLSFILGECESSRLVCNVKERSGLAHRIDSSVYAPLDRGLFSVNLEVDSEHALPALEAVAAEVERLRHEPVSRQELERARTNFLATQHFERESVSGLASKLGSFHVLGGDWQSEARYFELLRGATPEDLLRVAQTYLSPHQVTIGGLLPEREHLALDHDAVGDATARGADHAVRAFATPRRTHHVPATTPSGGAIERYELANGATLHVASRREIPVVAMRAAFGGGQLAESPGTAGISGFLTGMWLRGTHSRTTAGFARAAEDLAAEIDGFSGRNSLGLTLEVSSDAFEPALELFAEVLLEPAFDAQELERERSDTLAAIERQRDHLAVQTFQLFGETLFPTHPYRLPLVGTEESITRLDTEALRRHHDQLVGSDNVAIAVAGDVDPDRVAQLVSARLAALPPASARPPEPPVDPEPREIRRAERAKDRAQAHIVLGFRGLTIDDPDRYALEVISQLLAGQGGRLFLDLRDQRSLAYSVSAANVEGVAPGFFSTYIATSPEKVDEACAGMLEHLERLVNEAPAVAELERAIRYLVGNDVIELQRNASHAAHIALDALYGLGPEAHRHFAERLRAVTADDVLRVARRVLRLDAYTLAMVRPAS